MTGMKHGQGAAKAAPEPTRTPERQALADAIAKLAERRQHLARAEQAKQANGWEAQAGFYSEKRQAEETIRNLPQLRKDYVTALAYGQEVEKPPTERDLQEVIARCEREITDAQELEQAQDKVIADLTMWIRFAEDGIRDAAVEAMRSDPVVSALVEECSRAQTKFQYLNRAIRQFAKTHGDGAADLYLKEIGLRHGMPPCPYAEAQEALRFSADAPVPTLEEALSRL